MGKHSFGKRALADLAALGDCVVPGVRARRKKARPPAQATRLQPASCSPCHSGLVPSSALPTHHTPPYATTRLPSATRDCRCSAQEPASADSTVEAVRHRLATHRMLPSERRALYDCRQHRPARLPPSPPTPPIASCAAHVSPPRPLPSHPACTPVLLASLPRSAHRTASRRPPTVPPRSSTPLPVDPSDRLVCCACFAATASPVVPRTPTRAASTAFLFRAPHR